MFYIYTSTREGDTWGVTGAPRLRHPGKPVRPKTHGSCVRTDPRAHGSCAGSIHGSSVGTRVGDPGPQPPHNPRRRGGVEGVK